MLYLKGTEFLAKRIFRKPNVEWAEPLTVGETAIFVSNHSGANGPAFLSLYLDIPKRPWIINYILNKDTAKTFIFHDFFSGNGKKYQPLLKGVAAIVAKLLPPILQARNPIPVYHDSRMLDTFKQSAETLTSQNKSLIVFPEKPKKYSDYIFELYEGFVDIAHQVFKETGKVIRFFPTYVCASLRKILIGKPISYDPTDKPKSQRKVITNYIKEQITLLGASLPKHKTIPFLTDEWFSSYGQYADDMSQYWALFTK